MLALQDRQGSKHNQNLPAFSLSRFLALSSRHDGDLLK
jgi:hypothetical protein